MAQPVKEGCQPSQCASCGENCPSRAAEPTKAGHPLSNVKKVIGIVSGKGGVGKSMVTGTLASAVHKKGKNVGVLDADITGPSIPKIFGVEGQAFGNDMGILPLSNESGIEIMSMNLLMDDKTDPVVWRGPIIGNIVKQFWTDVNWGEKDYLFVDMPPGTGDVPLTVFQSMPVDGIIIVTTPQDLVSMIVEKAVKMAEHMDIPILGIVENMSYLNCPDCGKEISVFGESHIDEIAEKYDLPVLARIPINPEIAKNADAGTIDEVETPWLEEAVEAVTSL